MKAKSMLPAAGVALLAFVAVIQLLGSSIEAPAQQAPATTVDATAAIEKAFGPTRQVQVTDPFYNNIVAYTITIPQSWVFEGTVLHGPGCAGLDYQSLTYRAYSADAAFGVQVVPKLVLYYWEENIARPNGPACKFFAPISSADYAAMFTYRTRPNAQIDRSEPTTDADQFYANLEKTNETLVEGARQWNITPEHDSGDVTRTRIHYEWEGFAEEEWLAATIIYKDMPETVMVYNGGPRPPHPEPRHYLQSIATLFCRRAPRGKLDQYDAALSGIGKSITFNPQFVEATNAHGWDQARRNVAAMWQTAHTIIQAIQNQELINFQNSQAFMNAMTQQHEQFMANMQRQGELRHQNAMAQIDARTAQAQGFMAQMDARTAHTRDFQDYLLDQQYYVNPQTGETSTVSGRSTHTWANGPATSNATSVIQSPNGSFNPNGSVTGNWTELVPIHH